uniref:Uncharacterized protein n=1 Tax=Rhizophora mucronata TaxID=61149 RepID=A0A2P2R140_RHIMU
MTAKANQVKMVKQVIKQVVVIVATVCLISYIWSCFHLILGWPFSINKCHPETETPNMENPP